MIAIFMYTECAVDLVFMVDTSGSVQSAGESAWANIRQFMRDIVQSIEIGDQGTRVGLVNYASSAQSVFYLSWYNNRFDVQVGILPIDHVINDER